ncbi:MAG: hypothetical protein AAGA03_15050, partial [Planctomycetota bacterium]
MTAFSSASLAQDADVPVQGSDQPTFQQQQRINELIAQLGAPRLAERTEASRQLRQMGTLAAEAIAKAAKYSSDLEIQVRAEQIDRDLQLGLLPGTPASIADALRQLRSSDPRAKLNGLQGLMRQQAYERVVSVIRVQRSDTIRQQLAKWVLSDNDGQRHFLVGKRLPLLLSASRGERDDQWDDRSLVIFDVMVVSQICNAGNLDALITYFDNLPGQSRWRGMSTILASNMVFEILVRQRGADGLIALLNIARSREEQRNVASAISGSGAALVALANQGHLAKLIELGVTKEQVARRVLLDQRIASNLIEGLSQEMIVDLMGELQNEADQIQAITLIFRPTRGSAKAKRTQDQIGTRLLDHPNAAVRSAYISARLKQLGTDAGKHVPQLQELLAALVKTKDSVGYTHLRTILLVPDARKSIPAEEFFGWLAGQIRMLPDTQKHQLNSMLHQNPNYIDDVLSLTDNLASELLFGLLQSNNETYRERFVETVSRIRPRSSEQIEKLISLILRQSDVAGSQDQRARLLRCIARNQNLSNRIAMDKQSDELFRRIDALAEIDKQFSCWIDVLANRRLSDQLKATARLEVLKGFRNASVPAKQREQLLNVIVHEDRLLSVLIDAKESGAIERAIDEIKSPETKTAIKGQFMTHPMVLSRFIETKNVQAIESVIASSNDNEKAKLLSKIARTSGAAGLEQLGPLLWREVDSVQPASTRNSLLLELFRSQIFVRWLVSNQTLTQTL